ncbi:hypothetical protein [Ectobacillus panaciterrae]|uniref:hypothetical protein n=1 Tax=Ectobacillus panaciterrae TaxID=363872 RepID=UPI0003FCCE27|nr:hypothetical protein [Ectobacillus panaciterrae]
MAQNQNPSVKGRRSAAAPQEDYAFGHTLRADNPTDTGDDSSKQKKSRRNCGGL